ncbi:MAG: sarcosine oxidase subunit gamma [Rhodobacteraceae bacterium]|uniref:sarcosine oxidase subunit gamma n=1 Tax=Cypionkella sp. TaxID=2811411 RepID=UPI00132339BC|nr:sarcosine oxidase subunit gamma family protein [Cypionkella sp.]KAF0171477.1 MAG: sarcosine oxidase subunit gamma [Paracoccaceae bacterium]MDO8325385.1 sarcosine oxidase subunit gamma family protein [Cypionkella sp.]
MSNVVSALGNASFAGFAKITEVGPLGMISLRAKPDVKGLAEAIKAAVGTAVPAPREIEIAGGKAAGWMSPDEYLLVLPYGETDAALAAIAQAFGGAHHLAVVVSDARAVFRVEGAKADQVLAKLSPVDFATLGPKELRRTRAAQVAAAFWKDGDGYTLVCFRSVASYVMGLLTHSAMPGSEF